MSLALARSRHSAAAVTRRQRRTPPEPGHCHRRRTVRDEPPSSRFAELEHFPPVLTPEAWRTHEQNNPEQVHHDWACAGRLSRLRARRDSRSYLAASAWSAAGLGDGVIASSRVRIRLRGACLADQAAGSHLLQRSIERSGRQLHRASGDLFDLIRDAQAMTGPPRQREQNVKCRRFQRRRRFSSLRHLSILDISKLDKCQYVSSGRSSLFVGSWLEVAHRMSNPALRATSDERRATDHGPRPDPVSCNQRVPEPHFPLVPCQLRRQACTHRDVRACDVRLGGAAANQAGGAARRSVQLSEWLVLPGQAGVFDSVQASTRSRVTCLGRWRVRHHSECGACTPDTLVTLGVINKFAGVDVSADNPSYRKPLDRSAGRSPRTSDPTAVSFCSAASHRRSTWTCCCRYSATVCSSRLISSGAAT